jgi:hypothetical protein
MRKRLKLKRGNELLTHRDALEGYFQLLGYKLHSKEPLINFKVQSKNVGDFLAKNLLKPHEFVLCFVDAGCNSRNWISSNISELRASLEELNLSVLFVDKDSEVMKFSFTEILEVVSLSKFALSNDTGWAHCVIEMKKPLLCFSSTVNEGLDLYIRETEFCRVVRPDALLEDCTTKCQKPYFHCISTISITQVRDSLKYLSRY